MLIAFNLIPVRPMGEETEGTERNGVEWHGMERKATKLHALTHAQVT